jgi:DNA primase
MRDGREVAFLFLPEGEDPDSLVRREGRGAFLVRVGQAQPLSDFLLQRLRDQVDLHTLEGRARLLERARPALRAIPQGAFRALLEQTLARLAGMEHADLMRMEGGKAPSSPPRPRPTVVHPTPVQRLMGLILAHPVAAQWIDPSLLPLLKAGDTEAQWLLALIELARASPHLSGGGLLEGFREHPAEPLFGQLLIWQPERAEEGMARECRDICRHLLQQQARGQIDTLLEKAAVQGLDAAEKEQLRLLLSRRGG